MRSFTQIITASGTDDEVAAALDVKKHQPRDWRLRNSVPPEHWMAMQERGWTSLEELACAAAAKAQSVAA